jgi:hypothetical protein
MLSANGGVRASVKVNRAVNFSAVIELPPDTGKIVGAEWDFDGKGSFPVVQEIKQSDITGSGGRVSLTISHAFSKPGTYFPALRATSQRQGDATTPFARIYNLGRVRVVVK